MKTMMKRIVSFALAALLVLGMAAVTGATALDVTNPTVTITEVENGDTVKAYKLISYKDANYNEYEFNADFERYIGTVKAAAFPDISAEAYLEKLTPSRRTSSSPTRTQTTTSMSLTQTLSGISAPSRQQPSRTSPPRRTSKS